MKTAHAKNKILALAVSVAGFASAQGAMAQDLVCRFGSLNRHLGAIVERSDTVVVPIAQDGSIRAERTLSVQGSSVTYKVTRDETGFVFASITAGLGSMNSYYSTEESHAETNLWGSAGGDGYAMIDVDPTLEITIKAPGAFTGNGYVHTLLLYCKQSG